MFSQMRIPNPYRAVQVLCRGRVKSSLARLVVIAASIVVGATASAEAKLFAFTFDATGIDIDGRFVTNNLPNSVGGLEITSISGTVNGLDMTSLVAANAPAIATVSGGIQFDNVLYAPSSPRLDNKGVLFNGPSGEYNVYTDHSTYSLSDKPPDVGIYGPGTEGTFTVTGVPELSTWAMLIIGFGGVGLQVRRRSRHVAVTA
jgi:hypothetical protein